MRKASIAEVQHHLNAVLEFVEQGEKVLLTRRNKVIAQITPVSSESSSEMPSFYERAQETFKTTAGQNPSEIIIEDRKERF